jgi:hypothetical protein
MKPGGDMFMWLILWGKNFLFCAIKMGFFCLLVGLFPDTRCAAPGKIHRLLIFGRQRGVQVHPVNL